MPISTDWSSGCADAGQPAASLGPAAAIDAARKTLARALPPGTETAVELRGACDQARAVALAAGSADGALLALAALVAEVLAGMSSRLERLDVRGDLIEQVASKAGVDADALGLAVATQALAHPRIAKLPAHVGVAAVLELLVLVGPVAHVSLWRRRCGPGVDCFVHAGPGCPTRSVRSAARRALAAPGRGSTEGLLQVVVVGGHDDAALVARPRAGARSRSLAFLRLAAAALAPLLDRVAHVERVHDAAELAAAAGERRLARIGFDLHDGPIQSLAALLGDARLLQTQVRTLGDDERMERIAGRVGDLSTRVVALEFELRTLCQSLESPTVMRRPLERVIEHEVVTFQRMTGITPRVELSGSFERLSESQRIALLRIVQETLRNVREHAQARSVAVLVCARPRGTEAIVLDDGHGFDVDAALERAVRDGRIGLIGMMERVRLLGGECAIRSRPGGPTTVAATLPHWQPAASPRQAREAAAA